MNDANSKVSWFKKHKVLTLVIALVILGAIGAASPDSKKVSDVQPKAATATATTTKAKPVETAKLNQAVRDGKFEFTVKSVDCGQKTIGDNSYLTKTAQGQFCVMSLDVKNIGNESQSLLSSNQYLYNAAKQKYSADDTATIYLDSGASSSWYSNINPGNTVSGKIAFDIPADQTPVTAELHDSSLSGGVKIQL